jgi:PIN domain nuclease of toxin-antitoxin system
MKYLLDTCAWIDALLAPEKLSKKAHSIIASPQLLYLCDISLLEFARKEARGEIILKVSCRDWLETVALPPQKIKILTIELDIAIDATRLPGPMLNVYGKEHKDPADQIIVATARYHSLTLITSDQVLLSYPHVQTLNSR